MFKRDEDYETNISSLQVLLVVILWSRRLYLTFTASTVLRAINEGRNFKQTFQLFWDNDQTIAVDIIRLPTTMYNIRKSTVVGITDSYPRVDSVPL